MIERILKFNGNVTHREIEIDKDITVLEIDDLEHPKIKEFLEGNEGNETYSLRKSVIPFSQNTGVRSQVVKNLEAHVYIYG